MPRNRIGKFIPQIEPYFDGTEAQEILEVIESTYITENKKTEEFLEGIKTITHSPYAIATSNGTLALVAALMAAGIKAGDEVIIPDLTFIATSNAVRLVGAKPVVVDVSLESGCLDIEAIVERITSKTKAVVPVHLYGHMVDMPKLMDLALKYRFEVIEDAAEAMGNTFNGQHAGTFGRFGTFSFFANKTITCGEGGVVLCRTEADYKSLYRIKNHGRDRKGTFIHDNIGYNFCFTDLQAAIGVAQLKKLGFLLGEKKRVYDEYERQLNSINSVSLMKHHPDTQSNYWFINILTPDPEALGAWLFKKNIGTRRFFLPFD